MPPGYGYAPAPVRPSRKRKERIGIPLVVIGFVLGGVGLLLIGVGSSEWVNAELGTLGSLGGGGSAATQALFGGLNASFLGVDVSGAGVVVGGIGAGINVFARFDQEMEFGRTFR